MAYLNGPASTGSYGVVEIGDYILVDSNGIISLPQSIATTASVTFSNVSVTDTATISTANITTLTVANELATGNIVVSGNLSITSNTPSTSSTTGALVVTGGLGVSGNVYAGEVFDSTNRVVTSVTPAANVGISLSNVVTSGPATSFTINNTGVLSLIAGSGVTLSSSTGNITVSSSGSTFVSVTQTLGPAYTATATDNYIGVYSAVAVTVTLPPGINGRQYSIKDEYGQGSGKITIDPDGTDKIDNALTYVISVPFASVTVVYRGGGSNPGWHII